MITLRFLHDTPFDKFEGTYKLAIELCGNCDVTIALDESIDPAHIVIQIYGYHTVEEVEDGLAYYSHWFTAEEDA